MNHIGERVKEVREAKGLSLKYVGARLQVAHTTVLFYEQCPDLKNALLTALARILEVSKKYLTGDDEELENLEVKVVVRRESLRLFLNEIPKKASAQDRRRFAQLGNHAHAKKTVAEWRELWNLIQGFLGRPPGCLVGSPADDGDLPATTPRRGKKRMANVTEVSRARIFRRVS